MMGSSQQPRWAPGNQIIPNLTHGIKTISIGYISPGRQALVMRGPMLHQIIRQFLQQVDWGELDYLIVDLPPGTGDVVISLVQTVPLTGAVVISTPSDVSLQDARKALEMFRPGERRGAGHRGKHEPASPARIAMKDRHLLQGRRGADSQQFKFRSLDRWNWCPQFARAEIADSRWRLPAEEPAGGGVLRRSAKADGARRAPPQPATT